MLTVKNEILFIEEILVNFKLNKQGLFCPVRKERKDEKWQNYGSKTKKNILYFFY